MYEPHNNYALIFLYQPETVTSFLNSIKNSRASTETNNNQVYKNIFTGKAYTTHHEDGTVVTHFFPSPQTHSAPPLFFLTCLHAMLRGALFLNMEVRAWARQRCSLVMVWRAVPESYFTLKGATYMSAFCSHLIPPKPLVKKQTNLGVLVASLFHGTV